ncbi:hypothetical protein ACM93F_004082 [Enterobacter ludwigii]
MQQILEAKPYSTQYFIAYVGVISSIVQVKTLPSIISEDFHFNHVQGGMISYEVI